MLFIVKITDILLAMRAPLPTSLDIEVMQNFLDKTEIIKDVVMYKAGFITVFTKLNDLMEDGTVDVIVDSMDIDLEAEKVSKPAKKKKKEEKKIGKKHQPKRWQASEQSGVVAHRASKESPSSQELINPRKLLDDYFKEPTKRKRAIIKADWKEDWVNSLNNYYQEKGIIYSTKDNWLEHLKEYEISFNENDDRDISIETQVSEVKTIELLEPNIEITPSRCINDTVLIRDLRKSGLSEHELSLVKTIVYLLETKDSIGAVLTSVRELDTRYRFEKLNRQGNDGVAIKVTNGGQKTNLFRMLIFFPHKSTIKAQDNGMTTMNHTIRIFKNDYSAYRGYLNKGAMWLGRY